MRCKLCVAIGEVDRKDAAAIVKAVKYKEITNTQLAEIMTRNGYPISEAGIRRHAKHKDK